MIAVISPAKTLDFETSPVTEQTSELIFPKETKQLVGIMKKKKSAEIASLMSVSEKIADLNYERYRHFYDQETKQAALAFKGDVYLGLEAESMKQKDFDYAQGHLRILSGLYGLLAPLDAIYPYRLEMGIRLENRRGKNLYEFWDDKITKELNKLFADQEEKVLINLASNEYFKAVKPKGLKAEVITCDFKDEKNGEYKMISFFAKKARGMMARYMIDKKVKKAEDLKGFDYAGYFYNEQFSTDNKWVFTRDKQD